MSANAAKLFVAVAGNNAIAVLELPNGQHTNSVVQGFLPTDWYPGAVAADSDYVYVPYYAKKVQKMDLSSPDRVDDDIFGRYIWHSIKGNARYPAEFVGGHGKGLKKLGLIPDKTSKDLDGDCMGHLGLPPHPGWP